MIQLNRAGVSLPFGSALLRLKSTLLPGKNDRGRYTVLEDITLWIGKGESWALVGESAMAKTTFLRLLSGRIPADSGTVTISGKSASAIAEEDGFFKHDTGEGNARLAYAQESLSNAALRARLKRVSDLFGHDGLYQKPVSEYDAPNRARLSLAIALASEPDILLIGNQIERCDRVFQAQCIPEIRRMLKNGVSLVLDSNDDGILARLCDHGILLQNGRLKRVGAFESVQPASSFFSAQKSPAYARQWLNQQQAAFAAPLMPQSGNDIATPATPYAALKEDMRRLRVQLDAREKDIDEIKDCLKRALSSQQDMLALLKELLQLAHEGAKPLQ